MTQFSTWYQFKSELQKEYGRGIPNADWLGVKPGAPLPWDDSHFAMALLILRQRRAARQRVWPAVVNRTVVSQTAAPVR
jgi:hypothetical protein